MSNHAVTPLSRRLAAVVMTYTTRPLVHWTAGIGLVVLVFATIFTAGSHRPADPAHSFAGLFFFTMGPLVFSMVLNFHGKSQFVTPAARLVPDYHAPHLATLLTLAILFLGLGPITGASALELAPVGSAALAICLGSLSVWVFHLPWLMLLLFAAVFSLTLPHVSRFWTDPTLSVTPIRLVFFAAGWWGFASWLQRLATMQEERDDYLVPPLAGALRRPGRNERAEQRKVVARQLNRHSRITICLVDSRIDSALTSGRLSKPELVRLCLTPYSALTWAVFLSGLFGGGWLLMLEWLDLPTLGALSQPVLFSGFMPALTTAGLIDTKRPQLEGDLLRPMPREELYMAVVTGYLRGLAIAVTAICLVAFAIFSIYLPERVSVATTLAFVSQAATTNFLLFAGNFYLASSFSAMARMAILYLPMMGLIAFNAWLWHLLDDYGVGPILACSLAYGLLAVLTLRAAHRRWLNVEVG